MKPRYSKTFGGLIFTIPLILPANAANDSWKANVSGNWNDTASWTGANVPGSTAALNSSDVATFGFTLATAGKIVTVDTNRNIGGITFSNTSGFGYTLSGGNLLLTNGGVVQSTGTTGAHTDVISSAIEIQGDGGAAGFTNSSSLTTRLVGIGAVTGVSTGANVTNLTLNGTNTGANAVTGVIGNGGGGGKLKVTKSDAGLWVLQNNSNSYSGGTTINSGILQVTSGGALGSGDVTLAGGELHLINNTNTAFNNNITVTGSSTISATRVSGNAGTASHTIGTLGIGAQTLTIAKFSATTLGSLAVGATTLTGNATFATNAGTSLTLGATVGSFSITKTAAGTLVLSSANTYSGSTNINGGIVRISASNHLGDGSATNTLSFNGGTLQSSANTYSLGTNRSINLTGTGTIQVDAGKLTIDGDIGGASSLTKTAAGVLELTGTNTYAGGTNIANGLLIANGASLASGNTTLGTLNSVFIYGTLSVDIGTTFTRNVGSGNNEIRWLESGGFAANGSGTAYVNLGGSPTPATLTQGVNGFYEGSTTGTNADSRLALGDTTSTGTIDFRNSIILNGRALKIVAANGGAAVDSVLSGDISGTGNGTFGVVKIGSGTTSLAGSSSYSGDTQAADGTLLVNGSITSTASVTSAGTLGGTGTIGGAVTVAGKLSPGTGIQSLETGAVSFTTGSSLLYEMDKADAEMADLLDVNATISLTGTVVLSLTGAEGGWAPGDKVTLISYFDIDGVTPGWNGGTFSGIADDSLFTSGSNTWLFDYNDTSGGMNFSGEQAAGSTARFVTMTLVPEPASILLGVLGSLAFLRRRR